MGSGTEGLKELRINGRRRRGHVPSQGLTTQTEPPCGELKIESEQPFVVVAGNSRRQELFAELYGDSHGQLLVKSLSNAAHVVHLAIAIVEKTIAVERPHEILKVLEDGRSKEA